MVIFVALLSLIICSTQAIDWYNDGSAVWAPNCDFNGIDIGQFTAKKEDCVELCHQTHNCTRFTWTDFEGGTCWLMNGNKELLENQNNGFCGEVNKEVYASAALGWPSAHNVRGTYWAEASGPGGCEMPAGNYRILDAVAVCHESELGPLIYKPGLCGKVLDIDCGHGHVQAVVVSTGTKCGVDMIGRTWRKATNNKPPGVVRCKVALTGINPLNEHPMVCYHRPGSDVSNPWHTIVGVINTNGKIATSAKLAGIQGTRGNDACFVFSGKGKPLFKKDAVVTFKFEDGGSVQFKLGDCRDGKQAHIFK